MSSYKILIWITPIFSMAMQCAVAHSESEKPLSHFDSRLLFGKKKQKIDLSTFSIAHYIAPGRYLSQVIMNGKYLGLKDVRFERINEDQTTLCIDPPLLKSLDLNAEIIKTYTAKACVSVQEISLDASYQFDVSELKLSISIPQAYTNQRPQGYISPDLFDSGVTAAFIRYDYNVYMDRFKDTNDNQNTELNTKGRNNQYAQYLNLDAGLNFDEWSYRHQGAFDSNQSTLGNYSATQNEFSRDITHLRSRISFGEFINRSLYIESIPLLGIQMYSELQMLAMSQRSYAPVIETYAQSNALLRIFQNGQKIDERTVAAGPVKINDLNVISSQGDLRVEVLEAGVEKRSFIVPLQANMNLVRPGQFNYNVAFGQYHANAYRTQTQIGQASAEYGLNNMMSLYGGSSLSNPYQAYFIGSAFNTFIGGMNLDYELSQYSKNTDQGNGHRIQASYRYADQVLGLRTQFNARRYSQDYLGVNQAMRRFDSLQYPSAVVETEQDVIQLGTREYDLHHRLKNQYSLSFNQAFRHANWGGLYLNLMQNSYWHNAKNYYQLGVAYNNHWRELSYSLGLSESENKFSTDRQIYFSLSVPFNFKQRRINSNSYVTHNKNQNSGLQASSHINGVLGKEQQGSFDLGIANNAMQNHGAVAVTGNITQQFSKMTVNGSFNDDSAHTQFSASAKGAIVAHARGLTAVNQLTDTYTIIHADQGQGAIVENAWGVRLDRYGNAIYPHSIPYQANQISIDPSDLALNLNMIENSKTIVPRMNSATFAEFNTKKSTLIVLLIQNAQHRFAMGTEVLNSNAQIIGRISQSNEVVVENEDLLTSHLRIQWGETPQQSCSIKLDQLNINFSLFKKNEFNIINVECLENV